MINGAEGIGTGWSTQINPFKVKDIVKIMKRQLEDEEWVTPIVGWEGYEGTIQETNKGGFIVRGRYSVDDHTVSITELPIKKWTRDYKSFLEEKL